MRRIIAAALAALLLSISLAAALAVTLTDDLGRTVQVEQPQRVAALLGSFAQVWQLAGGEVAATADDAWEDLHLPLDADTVNLGGTKTMSLELLFAARPDFILASTNTSRNVEWLETIEAAGIPIAYFDVEDFDDYLRLLKICTDITGRPELYEAHGLRVQAEIDAVLARSQARLQQQPAPRVLCMVASAASVRAKTSQGNVLGAMLQALGCINIAETNTLLLENLSMEYILTADPDMIFFVQRGDDEAGMKAYVEKNLMSSPLWQHLRAVREGRVYFMEKNLFNLKPNHRWGEAYAILEGILSNESDD